VCACVCVCVCDGGRGGGIPTSNRITNARSPLVEKRRRPSSSVARSCIADASRSRPSSPHALLLHSASYTPASATRSTPCDDTLAPLPPPAPPLENAVDMRRSSPGGPNVSYTNLTKSKQDNTQEQEQSRTVQSVNMPIKLYSRSIYPQSRTRAVSQHACNVEQLGTLQQACEGRAR
jgi:hypothetical protein